MSETGHVNDDPQAVLRLWARQHDERTVLSNRVVSPRKATRTRASSVVTRRDPSIMRPMREREAMIRDSSEAWASTHATIGYGEKVTVVRPGGRARLTDFHR